MTNKSTVKTWRERIGAGPEFPLHAPTDVERAMVEQIEDLEAVIAKYRRQAFMMSQAFHNFIVGNQAAWIEWQHGRGAEAAMVWIHNGLVGPGNIPGADEPNGKNAQSWCDEHSDYRMEPGDAAVVIAQVAKVAAVQKGGAA